MWCRFLQQFRWRWQHGSWRGGATSSTPPRTRPLASSSAPGASVGWPVAGAATPHVPQRSTTSTSSSRLGGTGPPASNGTSPVTVSPSGAACFPGGAYHWIPTARQALNPHTPIQGSNSIRAPARYGQASLFSAASPARMGLGLGGLPLAGVPGPTFLLTRGGVGHVYGRGCCAQTAAGTRHHLNARLGRRLLR